ncbi:O-antigen ligase family protein [Lelliottia amnigena]|uniref:O-antigen ligase family protein n=1 Tax=Lelliottia amnigena TaxID=61646 RepID=UPI00192B06F3|nr:O-antigen ligase family protein [Lelliottia amnigena]MBL5922001.1 O-antigen ligase family protein [Lelliottia amnigena]
MTNIRNILTGLLVLAVLALCFMWPIPNDQLPFHRNGLIYPIIVVALGLFFSSAQAKQRLDLSKIKFVLIVVWVLTFFILINGFFVAPDIKEMFSTWDGQWLRPVLLFCAGLVLLPAIQDKFPSISAARYFTLIVLFFWGVVCVHLLDTVWLYWRDGVIHWGETRIVFNRTRMSFQVNMITGFILAELLARGLLHQRFMRLNTPFLAFMLLCNLLCTALVDTRWGTIGLVGSLFSTFILLSFHSMRRSRVVLTGTILLGIFAASALLGYASWKTDPRWQNLESDAVTGWNAPFNSFCYNRAKGIRPLNDMGQPMDHSNGCRASFFHQGWKLVAEHPAGMGPRKEAFRYVLRRDMQDNRINIPHSHYGLIEFGIQNGIAGIAGWLILLAGCWYIGWREFRHGNTMIGLFLLLFTIGFFSRTMVDHNLKDHYLEQYMMLTGLLIGMCALRPLQDHKKIS